MSKGCVVVKVNLLIKTQFTVAQQFLLLCRFKTLQEKSDQTTPFVPLPSLCVNVCWAGSGN